MCLLGANIVKMFYIQNDFGKKCFMHKTNLIKKRFVEKTLRKKEIQIFGTTPYMVFNGN